jgi:hypothetical protein
VTAAEIRERLEDSRRRLGRRGAGRGMGAILLSIEEELLFLAAFRQHHPPVAMKVDALIDAWTEYRDWLQNHYE